MRKDGIRVFRSWRKFRNFWIVIRFIWIFRVISGIRRNIRWRGDDFFVIFMLVYHLGKISYDFNEREREWYNKGDFVDQNCILLDCILFIKVYLILSNLLEAWRPSVVYPCFLVYTNIIIAGEVLSVCSVTVVVRLAR